jgi:SAM-dependent methyltransferase
MYLLALGYRGAWGVDVGGDMAGQNRVLREAMGIAEPRFSIYDGRRLALGDGAADLVFSQQVLEHVTDDVIDAYYAEEARVLRPGGLAYHQLPHRWGPYDSHSRSWFLHWFPRPLRLAGYRLLKRNPDYLDRIMHLRAPGAHFRRARAFIGPVRDRTVERLTRLPDMASYEGSARLRRLIHGAVRLPVLGPLAAFALKRLAMLDTVAVRR